MFSDVSFRLVLLLFLSICNGILSPYLSKESDDDYLLQDTAGLAREPHSRFSPTLIFQTDQLF